MGHILARRARGAVASLELAELPQSVAMAVEAQVAEAARAGGVAFRNSRTHWLYQGRYFGNLDIAWEPL